MSLTLRGLLINFRSQSTHNLQPRPEPAHLMASLVYQLIAHRRNFQMFRRYFLPVLAGIAFIFSTSLLAAAQNGQLRGVVTLKQADGTTVPAANAVVDVFRWDLPGDFNLKTNKSGEFVHAGLPIQGTYVISVSMPGAQPYYYPNIRLLSDEPLKIQLSPGDGRRLTRADRKTL